MTIKVNKEPSLRDFVGLCLAFLVESVYLGYYATHFVLSDSVQINVIFILVTCALVALVAVVTASVFGFVYLELGYEYPVQEMEPEIRCLGQGE